MVRQDSKVRVAMVGAGEMANRVHYPSLANNEQAEIVGISDLSEDRLQATADRYGVAGRYSDYRRMVEETRPQAAYVIGPPDAMFPIWCWMLEHGIDLFIEKPLGVTLHQARILEWLARRNNCVTQVGFQRRASPLLLDMRKRCLARGPVVQAVCRFYKHDSVPMINARDRMLDDGVHAIDVLRSLCGGDVVRVQSLSSSVRVPDLNLFHAILEFDNGSTGILLNNWSSGRRIFSVEIHAPGITAEADLDGTANLFCDGDTAGTEYTAQQVAGSDELYIFGGFQEKTNDFLRAVRMRTSAESSFSDAIKTMEVAELILAQHLVHTMTEANSGSRRTF